MDYILVALFGFIVAYLYFSKTSKSREAENKYKEALQILTNAMNEETYSSTKGFKYRKDLLEKVGLAEATSEILYTIRKKFVDEYSLSPDFYLKPSISKAERDYIFKIAEAHDKVDEFNRIAAIASGR